MQLPAYVDASEIYSHYAYFSSYSDTWVAHAAEFVETMVSRLRLGETSLITEVASNDGYLLQHLTPRGIPVLGIEPAENIARVARSRGIRTETAFLGEKTGQSLAARYGQADLVIGNNVFAHVPDVLDFTRGLRHLVAEHGLLTLEFPHLLRLIQETQYDTIYHEHYSYYTLRTATSALKAGGFSVSDVDQLVTHGGSLRVYARPGLHDPDPSGAARIDEVLSRERQAGLHSLDGHLGFASSVNRIKRDLLTFLIDAANRGRTVVGYGAPGKGNTLLNHCGIRTDLLNYTVDRNPFKQGKFLPGTRIPIYPPERLSETRPDYVLILPWNLRTEISAQLSYTRDWGAQLVVAIPRLEVFN